MGMDNIVLSGRSMAKCIDLGWSCSEGLPMWALDLAGARFRCGSSADVSSAGLQAMLFLSL